MRSITVGLTAVIVAVTDEEPRVLTQATRDVPALPFGPLDPDAHKTLELGLRSWVLEQTGLELGYVEQLYTFGDRDREVEADGSRARVMSVAYLALVRESEIAGRPGARFRAIYDFFPWEDWRRGRPKTLDEVLIPALRAWLAEAADEEQYRVRRHRLDVAFGRHGTPWDGDRVLERYELLYEAGLVAEALRDRQVSEVSPPSAGRLGVDLALDHRRILATALGRLRGKIRYRPLVFELVPETFTLFQLQRTVEALAGVELHKQNFRRLVERGGLVEGTGEIEPNTGGRPAERFRFRREVLRERPAPGVGLPGVRRG